jgi:hypothetical protein
MVESDFTAFLRLAISLGASLPFDDLPMLFFQSDLIVVPS